MKLVPLMLSLLVIVGPALTVGAADLTKIDRTIAKEPKYSSQPYYGLLVVGPEATKRVWLVLDGEVLYVDRNGNGDLTEANERVELDVEATKKIKVAPGVYKGMNAFNIGEVAGLRLGLDFWVRDKDFVPKDDFDKATVKEHQENGWEIATLWRINEDGSRAQNGILLCPQSKDAEIRHLDGPLTFSLKWGERQSLKRGSDEAIFDVHIGTPGQPARNSHYPVFSPLTTSEVPADVHPVANFEFPNKAANQPPIKLKVVLEKRC